MEIDKGKERKRETAPPKAEDNGGLLEVRIFLFFAHTHNI